MGQPYLSRRGVWGLATILGHAHPRTTQKHYMHFHDDLSARFQRTLKAPALTRWQTANALGIYPEKVFGRDSLDTAISYEQHIQRLTGWPVASKLVEPHGLVNLGEPRYKGAAPATLGLEMVLRVMQTISHHVTLDTVARRLLVDETFIEKIMVAVLEVSRRTNFVPYSPGSKQPLFPSSKLLSRAEWKNLFKLGRLLDEKSDEVLPTLVAASKCWVTGYVPGSGFWLLHDGNDLDMVARALTIMGIDRSRWYTRFDPAQASENWYQQAMVKANVLGFQLFKPKTGIERLPGFPADRIRSYRLERFAVKIAETDTGLIRNMKVIHHFYLAMAVLASVRSVSES